MTNPFFNPGVGKVNDVAACLCGSTCSVYVDLCAPPFAIDAFFCMFSFARGLGSRVVFERLCLVVWSVLVDDFVIDGLVVVLSSRSR